MLNKFKSRVFKLLAKSGFKKETKISNAKYCPVCNNDVVFMPFPYNYYFNKFYEHGFVHSPFLFETLNLKFYKCENCGASDRDRLIALFIKKYLKKNSRNNIKLLDFAPSNSLKSFLLGIENIEYRSADLYMTNVDDVVDIRNMYIYDDNSFDLLICSHVLEHIDDDLKAMSEIHRILKSDGIAILLVPILLNLEESVENVEYLKSEPLRWKYFGQHDHVRQYSKNDFVKRLESCGFEVEQKGFIFFTTEVFENSGIDLKSVLYIARPNND
jgi:SAM-dependent methyltransferase